jgi:hypothetical protein
VTASHNHLYGFLGRLLASVIGGHLQQQIGKARRAA